MGSPLLRKQTAQLSETAKTVRMISRLSSTLWCEASQQSSRQLDLLRKNTSARHRPLAKDAKINVLSIKSLTLSLPSLQQVLATSAYQSKESEQRRSIKQFTGLTFIPVPDIDYHCTIGWLHNSEPLTRIEEVFVDILEQEMKKNPTPSQS